MGQIVGRIIHKLQLYGNICSYCRIELHDRNFSVDHVVPVSKGGENSIFNKVASCQGCNKAKSDMPLEEFLQRFWHRRGLKPLPVIMNHLNKQNAPWKLPVIEPKGNIKQRADWVY